MRYGLYGLGGLLVVGGAVALIVVFAFGGKKTNVNVDFAALPGVSHSTALPWTPEINDLAQRLQGIGLQALPQEALNFHIHQHLDIYINGKHVNVPKFIGIDTDPANQFITELHTHDTRGIVHVESATARDYSLGEFFAVWGVYLSKKCIGGFCAKPGTPLYFYVNGQRYSGDPVTLVLKPHEEIAIVYGKPPKQIPQNYKFPPGY
jgi:hypothetical protein